MADHFEVHIVAVDEVRDIPGAWTPDDQRALLVALEMDEPGLSDAEVSEYVLLALQEKGEEDAPLALLNHLLTDDSSSGARGQTSRDFKDDRPWDEYADLSQHHALWRAAYLLNRAFPGQFSTPELARAEFGIVALDDDARDLLRQDPLPVSLVARLLAGDGTTPVGRLFEDEVAGDSFPDAPSIIWHQVLSDRDLDDPKAPSVRLKVWSSVRWLMDLERLESFKSAAREDAEPAEDD